MTEVRVLLVSTRPDRRRDLHRWGGNRAAGRPGEGKKTLVGPAVELHEPKGFGRDVLSHGSTVLSGTAAQLRGDPTLVQESYLGATDDHERTTP